MRGAREYAELFQTGKYGKLYLISGSHARGKTFNIFVLPKMTKEEPFPKGVSIYQYPDKVEVYGIISGEPGWTEEYGWLKEGPWCDDFQELVKRKQEELLNEKREQRFREEKIARQRKERLEHLIGLYKES